MKVIYQSLTKTLSYGVAVIEKLKVLLMALTVVAAIQVDGTTIHTALGIGTKLSPLYDKMKRSLRNHLSDLKVIVIDEISMVSNELLFYVHISVNEIFGSVNNDLLQV